MLPGSVEDSICIKSTQNIVVLSTPSEDRARKYGAINKLRFGEQEFEASAYRAAPDNTSKGLIRGISKEESPEDIVTTLVTPRNPGVLHAKRMGNTDKVIVLFEGFYVPSYVRYGAMLIRCSLYKKQIDICYECGRTGHRADVCPNPEDKICRGCGCKNPQHDHNCQAECQLCGRDYLTGDKNCDARYKIPYLVRRRRWERRRREEQYAEEYYNHNNKEARGSNNNNNNHTTISSKHPSTDKEETSRKNYEREPGRDRSGSFPRQSGEAGRGRSRSRSSTRSRTRSRSRPRSGSSTSRGGDGSKAQRNASVVSQPRKTQSPKENTPTQIGASDPFAESLGMGVVQRRGVGFKATAPLPRTEHRKPRLTVNPLTRSPKTAAPPPSPTAITLRRRLGVELRISFDHPAWPLRTAARTNNTELHSSRPRMSRGYLSA
ncbi:hypothetical protein HPB49_025594 [Dermacentor silvarum]|uniref:Uncharacterized protein n=1 Tax=Dermacentor silvarum TaxID=543639 RepID=A0ACB8E4X7_DERSI|nr:hypothetical protein HPB49_025594 [Dermacentor silvarum]